MKNLTAAGIAATSLSLAWFLTGGCSGTNAPTPTVGGTGAFGVVTVNGKQLLYFPNESLSPYQDDGGGDHGYISVVDVGQPGNGMTGANALYATIDLGGSDYATATAGDANVVVAAGTSTYKVWFINPSTNTVTKTITLDPSLNGSSFSGGGGIVTGIALDEANNRAILSVWDGYLYIDLGSMTVTGGVTTPPAENFGFDGTHELILNPFYNCGNISLYGDGGENPDAGQFCFTFQVLDGGGVMTSGANIVNLKTNKIYTYQNLAAVDPQSPDAPLGSNPDSAAIDPSLQIAAIPPEYESQENFLDLSKAVYDDATASFTAPFITVPMQEYDGVAIESKSHLAFFEEEFDATIALVDLTKLSDDAGLPPSALVQAIMPNTPFTDAGYGDEPWENHGDPHGIAVTTGLQTAGPVGFVVTGDGQTLWVARINLQTMLSLGPTAGGITDAGLVTNLDAGWYLSQTALAPAITMLNGAVHE